jgi:O-antigen ligase
MPKKLTVKQFASAILAISILIFGFVYLLETSETFYNRIFDIRNGKQTAAGSGRLLFWEASFDLWFNGNIFELFFGFGFEGLLDKIGEVTGIRVYAHNEFFTQLGQNGLLGVIFFIGYLVSLLQFIWKRRKMPSYRLSIAIYFLYVSLMLTQGGMWFELDIFMVLVFLKLEFEATIFKNAVKQRKVFQRTIQPM